ncbi:MAG TPA: hypothetical protein PLD88_03840, partial [Candidatus Berkiella sp.]|nr:hypothetical protein [Candidatus Berkiella sp.]
MLDILIYAKLQAEREIFRFIVLKIIQGRYQWEQSHPVIQYLELALDGDTLAIDAAQLDDDLKKKLYMLAMASHIDCQFDISQFDAETLDDLMMFSCAFGNINLMHTLIKHFYIQTESTYDNILAAAFSNADI